MRHALALADQAAAAGDVPVGAVILASDGTIIGEGYNQREVSADPLAHAELVALRQAASQLGNWRLDDATVIVTLEPCAMCAGAIAQARLGRLVFGAFDEKAGAVASLWDLVRDPRLPHRVEVVSGILRQDCESQLAAFFAARRGDRYTDPR